MDKVSANLIKQIHQSHRSLYLSSPRSSLNAIKTRQARSKGGAITDVYCCSTCTRSLSLGKTRDTEEDNTSVCSLNSNFLFFTRGRCFLHVQNSISYDVFPWSKPANREKMIYPLSRFCARYTTCEIQSNRNEGYGCRQNHLQVLSMREMALGGLEGCQTTHY